MTPVQINDGAGLVVDLLDYGARIVQINFNQRKLACAYDALDDYASDSFYLGATIGPITNRIAKGQLTIGEQRFQMPLNEGENTLHSGGNGLDKEFWLLESNNTNAAIFRLEYDLTKAGLAGTLEVRAQYSVNNGALRIVYATRCTQDTFVNLSNHVYLNLSGENRRINDHKFEVLADSFVQVDTSGIPTGAVTDLDAVISYAIDSYSNHPEFEGSVDHHFNVGDPHSRDLRPMLKAFSQTSDIQLEVSGSSSGFQFYTGEFLSSPFEASSGFCVETQLAPDAINQPNFFAPILRAGQTQQQVTEYSFRQIG